MKRLLLISGGLWLLASCALQPAGMGSEQSLAESRPQRLIVVTVRNPAAPAMPRAGSTVRSYEIPSSYAVSPRTRTEAKAIASAHDLREVSAWPIGLLGVHCIVYELPNGIDRDQALERLRRDPRVESAQPFQSFRTLSATTPNDPYRSLQRNLDVLAVSAAHQWSRGENVRVAVIDTGIDTTHPDLAGRVVKQWNFVDDRRDTRDRHGTAVAGVIAAIENNHEGIVGIAPAAKLYGFRACWPAPGESAHALCSTLTLAKAIAAAVESRMDIVNLSLTGPADPLLRRLVEEGLRRGMVFVGARPDTTGEAGNFPTDIPGVIQVAAVEVSGPDDTALLAPGSDVLTLAPEGRYDFLSGSSLAAASISGGIALLLARDRSLDAEAARALLARTSQASNLNGRKLMTVNLCSALASLLNRDECVE
ncbi:MAG TPA: S8 family serine peptidase [Steroidobacteraceae bacterium]|jgi:hypothetical protein